MNKRFRLLFLSLFFGTLLILVSYGISYWLNMQAVKIESSEPVSCTIDLIATHDDNKVYVSYFKDSQLYQQKLDYYISTMKQGDTLTLYLNEDGKLYSKELIEVGNYISKGFFNFAIILNIITLFFVFGILQKIFYLIKCMFVIPIIFILKIFYRK